MRLPRLFLSALFFVALTVSVPARADENREYLNGGYYLLHNLFSDESNVPLLLDLKTAPPDLQDFAKKVGMTAKKDLAILDRMREADPALNWDKNPLPPVEQAVRDSIKGEKQHQLLFGTKGPDFARAFLVSQAEASKYAANIAKVLADREKDPDHRRDLQRMSGQWHEIYDEIFRRLAKY